MRHRLVAPLEALVAAAVLAACGSNPSAAVSSTTQPVHHLSTIPTLTAAATTAPATTAAATTAPATTVAPPPTAPATIGSATTDRAPDDPAFSAALQQWMQGASAISAEQGQYWRQAASDLTNGAATDRGDTSGYAQAASELENLASLPDAMDTPSQSAEIEADVGALDSFFGTPGLYG